MKHYLAVIVILDPTNHIGKSYNNWIISSPDVFIENVNLWKKYMNSDEDILCLFGQAELNLDTDYILDLENNILRVKSGHSYAGNEHIIKQFKIVDSIFSYDYIISATSSSFWVFPKLKHELIHNTAKTGVYKGRCIYHQRVPYVSGSGIIMSKDTCELLIKNAEFLDQEYKLNIDNHAYDSDALFGHFLHQNGTSPIATNWFYDFDNNSTEYLYERIKQTEDDGVIQYRIKNQANRLYYDTVIMNALYIHYYVESYTSTIDIPQNKISPKGVFNNKNKLIKWLRSNTNEST